MKNYNGDNLEKKTRKMCVVDSLYSLFLYYLICGVNPDDLFIFSGGVAKSVRKNINHIYFILYRNDDIPDSNIIFRVFKRLVIIFKRAYGITRLRIILFFKKRKYNFDVYGQANLNFSFPLYEYENSYLIEDGVLNYMDLGVPSYNKKKFDWLYKYMGFHVDNYLEAFGTHKKKKKIYLTQNEVPEVIRDKTEVIDIKQLWVNKTEDEKNKILEIYNLKDSVNKIDNNTVLLLTECFSEDGLLPFNEEIKIYKELIEKQNDTTNLIIKTHPREKKNYKKIFPEFTIIDQPFPLEILKCMDLNIKKIITIASNASLNFVDECDIEIYEKETSSKELNDAKDSLKKQLLSKTY